MKLPTFDESVDQLKAVTGLDDFDPDLPLPRSGADSLDLVEWMYSLQDRYPQMSVDESLLEDVDDTVTFRDIHGRVIHAGVVAAVAAAGEEA